MPRLLNAADCYVSPARGEGWGRPLTEAMACGLAVIATDWGAPKAFMSPKNSLPLALEGLTVVDDRMDIPHYRGHKWAEPSTEHLVELLRFAVSNPRVAREIGERARLEMVENWQWSRAVEAALSRMQELLESARSAPSAKSASAGPSKDQVAVQWSGDAFQLHSLSKVNREICRLLARDPTVFLRVSDTDTSPPNPACVARMGSVRLAGWAVTKERIDVEVRHTWPPELSVDPAGRYLVLIQPWEMGPVPKEWVQPLKDRVDMIITPSSYSKECFVKSGIDAKRVRVVPNGVDTEVFCPQGALYPLATEKAVKILYVGGTIFRKGFDVALDAYLATFGRRDDVCLVVKTFLSQAHYKNMNEDERLRRASSDPQLAEIEIIEDDLSDAQLASLYRSCDVLLLASRGEGFGLPAAEAMACGKPVVVTSASGLVDFCDEEVGWLIPCRERRIEVPGFTPAGASFTVVEPDREALSEILCHVVQNAAERAAKGEKGRDRIKAGFRWTDAASKMREAISEVLCQSPLSSKYQGHARPLDHPSHARVVQDSLPGTSPESATKAKRPAPALSQQSSDYLLSLARWDKTVLDELVSSGADRWLEVCSLAVASGGELSLDALDACYVNLGPKGELCVLAAAAKVARDVPSDRAVIWSQRLRAHGLALSCPLVAKSLDPTRPAIERVVPAALAAHHFSDPRALAALDLAIGELAQEEPEGPAQAALLIESLPGPLRERAEQYICMTSAARSQVGGSICR
ncbi:MAG: glycosyltransferase [Actinobacteria bacterium]|nr:glycosyltransferase [Actinomycetota bacterium]